MLEFLEGQVEEKRAEGAVMWVGGLGFFVHLSSHSLRVLPPRGGRARLLIHLQMREDGPVLYGFTSPLEREMFRRLISVSGVGPKMAMAILSAYRPEQLLRIVVMGDAQSLTAVSGVGKKFAQRIVLELKDKVAGIGLEEEAPGGGVMGVWKEVAEALRQLGYTPSEIAKAMEGIPISTEGGKEHSLEEVLKMALKILGKGVN